MMRLSRATETAIRLLPGNDRCMDCQAVFPQWAGVSFGVLLCLVCAGKHRSLGVQTSVVKSQVMDAWSVHETRAMAIGGNAKWTAVCAGARIVDFTMVDKYSWNVARVYRNQVALLAAAKELSGEECVEFTTTSFLALVATATLCPRDHAILARRMENVVLPLAITSKALLNSGNDAYSTGVKCTTCCVLVPLDQLDLHSKTCTVVSTSHATEWKLYERTFGAGGEPLGFTAAKTSSGFAEVSRIMSGGAAEQANVIVGSFLIGLNNDTNLKFDGIVDLLRTVPRPTLFHFALRSQKLTNGPENVSSSVPNPRTLEINVTLHDKEELGCLLSSNDICCVVRSVDEKCIARRHGILVGSRVVAVNGLKYLKPEDLIHHICTAPRPIQITVQRVEGLMRGWRG
uniref:Arf-GAP domain-containing protein n=1 Tax=Peronospora matthiolae TaxID=2874970 RepID=A0AAV1T393_9STRA